MTKLEKILGPRVLGPGACALSSRVRFMPHRPCCSRYSRGDAPRGPDLPAVLAARAATRRSTLAVSTVQAYLDRLEGDVAEIDGLNHYIGMRPLAEAAQLEQSLSVAALTVIALLLVGAVFIHTKWAALVSLPAMLFPAVFLGDMYYWLHNFGTNLDPKAPLSSSIKPFTPPVLGRGYVGQFSTDAYPGPGLILATVASALILVGLVMHRRAYKPLVDAQAEEKE